MELFVLAFGAILVNNFVLSQFLGICPFLGVSKRIETAFSMGVAVTFVMTLSAAVTHFVYHFVLVPLAMVYLHNIAFVLIIASLVQFIEMYMKKTSLSMYQALGVYLPLITTNCAVLGVVVLNMNAGYPFIHAVVHAAAAAIGFMLAIVLFAGIRERMDRSANIPACFKGMPVTLLAAGLMSVAFLGFSGII